uniref:Secreted protein n=1 Tax=Ascaris lumbricoides TaxID=6252 RepID=A0A0M3IDZ8_ASCLU
MATHTSTNNYCGLHLVLLVLFTQQRNETKNGRRSNLSAGKRHREFKVETPNRGTKNCKRKHHTAVVVPSLTIIKVTTLFIRSNQQY